MTANRFTLGVLLTGVMVTSNVIVFAVGALGPLLVHDLSVSRADLGLLVATYYICAAAGSALLGGLVGRAGARRSTAAMLVLGTGATLWLATADTYGWLFAGMVLGGVVASLANPATNVALAAVPGPLGVLVGIKQSGVQGGALLAGAVLPPVAVVWGWQAAFLVCTACYLVCLAGLSVLPRTQPAARRPGTPASSHRPAGLVPLAAYALCMGAGMATVTTYLPLYGHEVSGLSIRTAGWLLAVVGCTAVLARIAWSVLAERPSQVRGSLLTFIAAIAVVSAGLLAVAREVGAGSLWAGTLGVGVSAAAWNGVMMLMVIRDLPAGRTAVVSGQVQAAFFVGLCAGPPVFGALVDRFGSYAVGWGWSALCFVAASAAAVVTRIRWSPPEQAPAEPTTYPAR